MVDFFGILGIAATAFVVTNIDDLSILIAFFANSRFSSVDFMKAFS